MGEHENMHRVRTIRSMGAGGRLDALCVAVVVMRRSQKKYFRNPSPLCLVEAREAENAVDSILEEIMPGQGVLFPEDPRRNPHQFPAAPRSG